MHVFITGVTGYMGRRLSAELVSRGHKVRALVRPGSGRKLPAGCEAVAGNALEAGTFRERIAPADTLVHLVGVAHPSPAKAQQFHTVDLASVRASVGAAMPAGIKHFIYVSVAHPAPAMKAYITARTQGEALVRAGGFHATILRPWYVLGPGHRWPVILLPAYCLLERIPGTRDSARRLGLVTLNQMIAALIHAVEHPADGVRIVEVPEIRQAASVRGLAHRAEIVV